MVATALPTRSSEQWGNSDTLEKAAAAFSKPIQQHLLSVTGLLPMDCECNLAYAEAPRQGGQGHGVHGVHSAVRTPTTPPMLTHTDGEGDDRWTNVSRGGHVFVANISTPEGGESVPDIVIKPQCACKSAMGNATDSAGNIEYELRCRNPTSATMADEDTALVVKGIHGSGGVGDRLLLRERDWLGDTMTCVLWATRAHPTGLADPSRATHHNVAEFNMSTTPANTSVNADWLKGVTAARELPLQATAASHDMRTTCNATDLSRDKISPGDTVWVGILTTSNLPKPFANVSLGSWGSGDVENGFGQLP